jgi:hypothetical protein
VGRTLGLLLRQHIQIFSPAAAIEERSFHYAPLSSGLDIVRKTLSQHEMYFSAATSSENDQGSMNLASNNAPPPWIRPSSVAIIQRIARWRIRFWTSMMTCPVYGLFRNFARLLCCKWAHADTSWFNYREVSAPIGSFANSGKKHGSNVRCCRYH